MPSTYVDTKFNQAAFNLVWDVGTLRWVAEQQAVLDGGDINVSGPIDVAGDVGLLDQFDLTNSNPLTVAIVDASGNQITSFGSSDVNLDEVGGVATSLGQKTMAASIPVTLASDQTRGYRTATGTITANGQNVTLALDGATGASVSFVDSAFDGTFRFYSSCDGGATYIEIQAFNVHGSTGGTSIANVLQSAGITGARIWNFVLVGGESHVRVASVSGSSGSVAVTIRANDAAPNPIGLAVGPSEESDFGRPVGGVLMLARSGTSGLRSPRMTANRYEANVSSLVTLTNIVTTNNLSVDTTVADTNSSTTLLNQNVNRVQAFITNTSSSVLYVKLGSSAASATSFTVRLVTNATFEVPQHWIGEIRGIWATDPNDGVAVIQEIALA